MTVASDVVALLRQYRRIYFGPRWCSNCGRVRDRPGQRYCRTCQAAYKLGRKVERETLSRRTSEPFREAS